LFQVSDPGAIDEIWSERRITQSLYELVRQRQVKLLGATRQEVLSGIREESQFLRIRDHLRAFPNVEFDASNYEEAARAANRCIRGGIAGSNADLLMCTVAVRYSWQIFSTDRDFTHYRQVFPIQLFQPSQG
jgi:predicted nucleic acid-binding protein